MLCYKGIEDSVAWIAKAKPEPSDKDRSTQLGVHVEEFAEMLVEVDTNDPLLKKALNILYVQAHFVSRLLKETEYKLEIQGRVGFLDSLADQAVTLAAVAQLNGMDIVNALNEVNRSNWSKFDENDNPILDNNRKIIKGPYYSKPNLTNLV
jgi:hypothetical protein